MAPNKAETKERLTAVVLADSFTKVRLRFVSQKWGE